jgi:hypothetical protein
VQPLADHAQVRTTTRCDRRGEATRRETAGRLHVPYAPADALARTHAAAATLSGSIRSTPLMRICTDCAKALPPEAFLPIAGTPCGTAAAVPVGTAELAMT